MKHIATYQIHSTFKMKGRGIVFSGKILDGGIFLTGDYIEFELNGRVLCRKITGIDNSIGTKQVNPNVGLLIETKDETEIVDLRNWNPIMKIGKIYTQR